MTRKKAVTLAGLVFVILAAPLTWLAAAQFFPAPPVTVPAFTYLIFVIAYFIVTGLCILLAVGLARKIKIVWILTSLLLLAVAVFIAFLVQFKLTFPRLFQ